jgi:uracil-DNA glycosylase
MPVTIEASWKKELADEFEQDYFKSLSDFVRKEYKSTTVYPPPKQVFAAFDLCPFDKAEVVILGQDPYHGPRQANGLAFAVHSDMRVPPSLQNVFKEIEHDLGHPSIGGNRDGNLTRWAKQGVLLLNATLTVQAHKAGSHQGKGWEQFTSAVVERLLRDREHLVFMLWGNYAKEKGKLVDRSKHLVLEAAHPSPFSADHGFFGCKHFSKANEYLTSHSRKPIEW